MVELLRKITNRIESILIFDILIFMMSIYNIAYEPKGAITAPLFIFSLFILINIILISRIINKYKNEKAETKTEETKSSNS